MAGELAISVIEQTLTGDISSTDFMIQIICEGLKPINQNAQQKYDNRVKSNKEHKRETQQLDKIAELIDRGKTQEEIGKILGVSRQTVSNRIKIIKEEYPELIKVDKCKDVNSCKSNDNDNEDDNEDDDVDDNGLYSPEPYKGESSRVISLSESNNKAAPAAGAANRKKVVGDIDYLDF